MVVNITKIPRKMKSKRLLRIEKNEKKPRFIIIIKQYFNLKKFASL